MTGRLRAGMRRRLQAGMRRRGQPVGTDIIPGATGTVEAVGGGAEADVGKAAPVGGVVDGLAAGEGEVGNFVMDIAGCGKGVAEHRVLPGRGLVGGLAVPAGAHLAGQRAVRFDGQLIGGNVLRPQRDRFPQGLRPNLVRQL